MKLLTNIQFFYEYVSPRDKMYMKNKRHPTKSKDGCCIVVKNKNQKLNVISLLSTKCVHDVNAF